MHAAQDVPTQASVRAAALRPILVTGAPRSGSTWVGNMLTLAPEAGYIPEPFNKFCRAGICRIRFPHAFTYVTAANETAYLTPLQDTLAWRYSTGAELRSLVTPRDLARMSRDLGYFLAMRGRSARPVMKDPLAVFSAEWLAERFDMQVVVVVRHPVAFAASLRARNWDRFDFRILLDQPLLMQERLAPLHDEIAAAVRSRPDPIAASVLLWRVVHYHLHRLRQEHPEWIFLRHEDLVDDPEAGFRDAYARLGLEFSAGVRARIAGDPGRTALRAQLSPFGRERYTARRAGRIHTEAVRARLTPAEIETVTATVGPLLEAFYGDMS